MARALAILGSASAHLAEPAGAGARTGSPDRTVFRADKVTRARRCRSAWPEPGHALSGYEIRHGETEGTGRPLVEEGDADLGLVGERAVGTYLHGLLAADAWRSAFLNQVRAAVR